MCASPALHVSRIKAAASVAGCRASVRGKYRMGKEVQTRLSLTQHGFGVLDSLIDTIVIADECHRVVTDAADDLVRLDGVTEFWAQSGDSIQRIYSRCC